MLFITQFTTAHLLIQVFIYSSSVIEIRANSNKNPDVTSRPNPNPQDVSFTRLLPLTYAIHMAKVEEDLYKYMVAYESILKARLDIVSA